MNEELNDNRKSKNPAKFTDSIIDELAKKAIKYNVEILLDPFGGSGKIALIKDYHICQVHCNDIEDGWRENYDVDKWYCQDAEFLNTNGLRYDAIITSPTYGNRMADHHNAKDASKRITYTHRYGKKLRDGNTGVMHFGDNYKQKHERIFSHLLTLLKDNGLMMINVSNFIKKGVEIDVVGFWKQMLSNLGFTFVEEVHIQTPRMRFGANLEKRVSSESLLVYRKCVL